MQKTTFPNGLRVVTHTLESTQAATVLILVGAGSRYETKELNGISHFLEHMFFKGAEKYKNAKEVSEAIDMIGGDFNAFTGKEYVGYYVKVAARHVDTALDVLSDMLQKSQFDPIEIDKERGVIMEEYNMYQDTPMYQVGWDFERLMYGDQPMGWDQVGSKELINTVTREDFIDFQKNLYTPENIVVSVAGNIDHEKICAQIEKLFSMEKRTRSHGPRALEKNPSTDRIFLQHKKTEQTHIVVGFPAYAERTQEEWKHYAQQLLSIILGGNMSSRMFLGVREAKGLCYYISTSTDEYTDTGIISTRAGVDVKRAPDAVAAICEQYKIMRDDGITAAELHKAKEYIKGKMILRLEDCEEYAHLLGKEELLYNEVDTPDAIMTKVDAVTVEQVNQVARELFVPEELRLAVIGQCEDRGLFEKVLKM